MGYKKRFLRLILLLMIIIFCSELKESYLEVVWPAITSVLVTLLTPIHSVLQSNVSKTILNTGLDSIQDLHMSPWILLLQMSKLQRLYIVFFIK